MKSASNAVSQTPGSVFWEKAFGRKNRMSTLAVAISTQGWPSPPGQETGICICR